MQEVPIVIGFTAGELSPWLSTRFDLQAYQRGAARICNLQVQPYGGLELRPGTAFVGQLADGAVRLFPFSYAADDVLMLEFSPGRMRVYRDGTLLTNSSGSDTILLTPWTSDSQLRSLHFAQTNDAVYVCCPSYPPVVLYRYTDTEWRCEQPDFECFPRETYARQEGRLAVHMEQGGAYADLTIEGGNHLFSPDMANAEYLLADAALPGKTLFANETQQTGTSAAPDLRTSSISRHSLLHQKNEKSSMVYFYRCIRDYVPGAYNGSNNLEDYPLYFQPGIMRLDAMNAPYEVMRDWELTTTGTWNAEWELWRSYDTPEKEPDFRLWDWTCIKTFSQSDYETRQNWALSGSEPLPCRMVLVCRSCSDPAVLGACLQFRIPGGTREYKFRIESVQDAQHARARVVRTYMGNPVSFSTQSWSFGAMGARNGYPGFSTMFQGRLWLAGMPGLPTTLLASVVDDLQNFRMGSDDDAGMHLSIMGSDQNRICWLCATRQLLIGTSDSEWALVSGAGNMLTPTTVAFRRQSSVGSAALPANAVENTVLFVQRGGRRMREIAYRLEADGYSTTDVSLLAEHLLESGVKEWCVQRGSNFNIWALMNDGTLAVLTINLEQQVTAWQRVEFAGRDVLHLAPIQSLQGRDDEMWFVLSTRASGKVSLERMQREAVHLDSMQVAESTRNMELKCAQHLSGAEVCITDEETGESVLAIAGDAGLIAVPFVKRGRRYRVGIPIEGYLETMPMESANSFNSVRQFSRFKLRLLESDLRFDYRGSSNERWEHFYPSDHPDLSLPFTGALRLPQMPDAAVGQALCIRYRGQGDFRLLAITQEVDYHGK